jgi:hypothetical protein
LEIAAIVLAVADSTVMACALAAVIVLAACTVKVLRAEHLHGSRLRRTQGTR